MDNKENDIRLYTYSGYSTLNKAPNHIHKHRSLELAYATIAKIRSLDKFYKFDQIVLIDYSESRSKIIYIHSPGDAIPIIKSIPSGAEIFDLIWETNKDQVGRKRSYKKDDIIVWKGNRPGIFRVAKDIDATYSQAFSQECVITTTKSHDSLHISLIRPATIIEENVLGNHPCLLTETP